MGKLNRRSSLRMHWTFASFSHVRCYRFSGPAKLRFQVLEQVHIHSSVSALLFNFSWFVHISFSETLCSQRQALLNFLSLVLSNLLLLFCRPSLEFLVSKTTKILDLSLPARTNTSSLSISKVLETRVNSLLILVVIISVSALHLNDSILRLQRFLIPN
jgi:hypothetical protein